MQGDFTRRRGGAKARHFLFEWLPRMGGSLFKAGADLMWPRQCQGCGSTPDEGGRYLCWDCRAALPWIEPPYCARCGDPVTGFITNDYNCSLCAAREPAFDLARSAVRFRGGVKDWLHGFKYSNATHLASDLGQLLAAVVRVHYERERPDAVAYVPLYPVKERARTYNQARLLAAVLARELGLPLARGCLARVRDTVTQTHLTARQRSANVRDAFAVRHPEWVEGRHFLLVDDVMTTGATVNECARALKEAGSGRVLVTTVARG